MNLKKKIHSFLNFLEKCEIMNISFLKQNLFIFSHFLERIFKRNESQKEDSFQI